MEILRIDQGLRLLAFCVLISCSQALHALGLGDARVNSYLGQPLDVRIELISQSEEELAMVTAGLASADDFRMIGLDRAAISVPLQFRLNRELPDAHIRINSRLPVNEPVVQIVLEVTFRSGRMLREYTLFLDPPTVPSAAPVPLLTPSTRSTTQSQPPETSDPVPPPTAPPDEVAASDTETSPLSRPAQPRPPVPAAPAMEPDTTVAATEPEAAAANEPESVAEEIQVAEDDAPTEVATSPEESQDPPTSEDIAAEPEIRPEPESPPEEEPQPVSTPEPAPVPAQATADYGPVQRGETLWAIASRYVEGTGYSVNQAMLAIQRQNPEAFASNNINALRRGAILRMPGRAEMAALSTREAMLEAMSQEADYRALRDGLGADDVPPTVAADPPPAPTELEAEAPDAATDLAAADFAGRLELVPPSAEGVVDGAGEGGDSGQDAQAQSGSSVESRLARIEEDLANAQQENEYLNERIRELESQLPEARQDGTVSDTGLAELEGRLREERLDGPQEQPESVSPAVDEQQPWYRDMTWWILGAAALVLVVLVWLLRRSGGNGPTDAPAGTPDDGRDAVETIKDDAEELLRVLEPEEQAPTDAESNVVDLESYVEPGPRTATAEPLEPGTGEDDPDAVAKDDTEDADDAPDVTGRDSDESESHSAQPGADEQAVELDAEDPETKLDLARAYISMGDKEAARAILNDVIVEGNAEQAAEARGMMQEL